MSLVFRILEWYLCCAFDETNRSFFFLAGQPRQRMDLVVLGLARGFQVWTFNVSHLILGTCLWIVGLILLKFAEQRPFVAMVDTYTTVPDRQYCSVSVVSLSNGKGVRRFSFEEQICGLNTAARYLVVSLSTRLVIYDIVTLTEMRSVRVVQPPESSTPAVALNQQFIAYADFKVLIQNYLKATIFLPWKISTNFAVMLYLVPDIPLTMFFKGFDGCATVAHFVAHNEPLASMSWSPDGRLLLTTDISACAFNVFAVLTHPYTPLLSAVHHLYRLRRGTTIAKVVSCAFSLDCRWVSICTNHGTCHVFAISPYGGKPTRRTHGEHFTNNQCKNLFSEHPCMWNRAVVRSTANPRIGPYPPTILLDSVKKIRLTATNLIALGKDLAPLALSAVSSGSTSKRRTNVELTRFSLAFSSRTAASPRSQSLLIACADGGVVCEYELHPHGLSSMNCEDPPEIDITPLAMWTLQRTKNNPDMPPPLHPGSPLLSWLVPVKAHPRASQEIDTWISQVEVGLIILYVLPTQSSCYAHIFMPLYRYVRTPVHIVVYGWVHNSSFLSIVKKTPVLNWYGSKVLIFLLEIIHFLKYCGTYFMYFSDDTIGISAFVIVH
uniref:ANAPC4_WD40 domain-containing protein n=1 Tax=Angiostrongylus cantonensis TaxID=6313 RepID=A0A158PAN3_ANGCA